MEEVRLTCRYLLKLGGGSMRLILVRLLLHMLETFTHKKKGKKEKGKKSYVLDNSNVQSLCKSSCKMSFSHFKEKPDNIFIFC